MFVVDSEGTECASMNEVRNQAISAAGEILRDLAGSYPEGLEWQMHVTDEASKTVLRLRFSVEGSA